MTTQFIGVDNKDPDADSPVALLAAETLAAGKSVMDVVPGNVQTIDGDDRFVPYGPDNPFPFDDPRLPTPADGPDSTDEALTPVVQGDGSYALGLTVPTFVYNSDASQRGNRYNAWPDLMAAVGALDGPKVIQFEQDETIGTTSMPMGGWDLNGASLWGQGINLGITLTFTDGVILLNLSGLALLPYAAHGLVLYSTSTDPIVTLPAQAELFIANDVKVCAKTAPFFECSGATGDVPYVFGMEFGSGYVKPSDIGIGGGDSAAILVSNASATVYLVDRAGAPALQDDVITGSVGSGARYIMSPCSNGGAGDTQSGFTSWAGAVFASSALRVGFDDSGNTYVTGGNVGAALASVETQFAAVAATSPAVFPTTGIPSGGTGVDGNFAIDPAGVPTADVYLKASGTWSRIGGLTV